MSVMFLPAKVISVIPSCFPLVNPPLQSYLNNQSNHHRKKTFHKKWSNFPLIIWESFVAMLSRRGKTESCSFWTSASSTMRESTCSLMSQVFFPFSYTINDISVLKISKTSVSSSVVRSPTDNIIIGTDVIYSIFFCIYSWHNWTQDKWGFFSDVSYKNDINQKKEIQNKKTTKKIR